MRTDDGRLTSGGAFGGTWRRGRGAEAFLMFTTPSFETPVGKYDWLARSPFVGTLGVRANARGAALIRVFRVVEPFTGEIRRAMNGQLTTSASATRRAVAASHRGLPR